MRIVPRRQPSPRQAGAQAAVLGQQEGRLQDLAWDPALQRPACCQKLPMTNLECQPSPAAQSENCQGAQLLVCMLPALKLALSQESMHFVPTCYDCLAVLVLFDDIIQLR